MVTKKYTKSFKTVRLWTPRRIIPRVRILQNAISIITIRSRIKLIMILITRGIV